MEEWPVPKFWRIDALDPSKGWLVEYHQEIDKHLPVREMYCDAKDLVGLPEDG